MCLRPDLARFVEEWKLRSDRGVRSITEKREQARLAKEERSNEPRENPRSFKEEQLRREIGRRDLGEASEEERLKREKLKRGARRGDAHQFYLEKLLEDSKRKQPPQKHKIADIIIEDPSTPLPDFMGIPFRGLEKGKENEDLIMRRIRDD